MLYGQGSIGGILNLVSKRPQPEAMRELGVSYGSHDRKQVQADFTGPLDAGGSWLYRIVALGRDSDSAVKHAKDNRYFVAPSLTWRPSAATSLTLLGNLQEDDSGTMAGFSQGGAQSPIRRPDASRRTFSSANQTSTNT
ncbi:hypothetical protein WJ967_17100 [Achromobacter xylosoxidans]